MNAGTLFVKVVHSDGKSIRKMARQSSAISVGWEKNVAFPRLTGGKNNCVRDRKKQSIPVSFVSRPRRRNITDNSGNDFTN